MPFTVVPLDEIKRNAQKKKPLGRSFFLSQERLEYIVQGYGCYVIVVGIGSLGLHVEAVFAVESYVLSEGYIAFCTPEFNFFYFFVQESIQRGSVVGVSAEECISFSIYIGSSYAEGADFRIVLFAIAKACSPEVRITFASVFL